MKALLLLFAIICLAEDHAYAQEKESPPTNPPADNSQATLAQNSQELLQREPITWLRTSLFDTIGQVSCDCLFIDIVNTKLPPF